MVIFGIVCSLLLTRAAAAPMKCTDDAEGFIPWGTEVTGNLKLCPKDQPYVKKETNCKDSSCTVDEDRYTCCRTLECFCEHGDRTEPTSTEDKNKCEKEGAHDCKKCRDGYHNPVPFGLGAQKCVENICNCEGGTAAKAEDKDKDRCDTPNTYKCTACNPGWSQSDYSCTINVCKCKNGQPADDKVPHICEQSREDCESCNDGYDLTAHEEQQTNSCNPKTCSNDILDAMDAELYNVDDCLNTKTDEQCRVTCQPGYFPEDDQPSFSKLKCVGKDMKLTYTDTKQTKMHVCKKGTCGQAQKQKIISPNVKTTCKDSVNSKGSKNCEVECEKGYEDKTITSAKITVKCNTVSRQYETVDGDGKWTPTKGKLNCLPKPCQLSDLLSQLKNPQTQGVCVNNTVKHKGECETGCQPGYDMVGQTKCNAGEWTIADCKEKPCSLAPVNHEDTSSANPQKCGNKLEHNESCKVNCNDGYYPDSPWTKCDKGQSIQTKCKPMRDCTLKWKKTCSRDQGYWIVQDFTYEQCEDWCNLQHRTHSTTPIMGCELSGVNSEAREDKGDFCFAHILKCKTNQDEYVSNNLLEKDENAAGICKNGDFGGVVKKQNSLSSTDTTDSENINEATGEHDNEEYLNER